MAARRRSCRTAASERGAERPGDRQSVISLAPGAGDVTSETARIVIVNPVANSPASGQRTHQRHRSLKDVAADALAQQHRPATAGTSSPPGYSTTSGDSSRSIGPVEASFPPRPADGPSVLVWIVGLVEVFAPRVRGRTGHASSSTQRLSRCAASSRASVSTNSRAVASAQRVRSSVNSSRPTGRSGPGR